MTLATEKQLTVSELRTILKERGVSATGTKKELQERLRTNNQLFVVQDLNNNLNEMLSNKNNEIVELHDEIVELHDEIVELRVSFRASLATKEERIKKLSVCQLTKGQCMALQKIKEERIEFMDRCQELEFLNKQLIDRMSVAELDKVTVSTTLVKQKVSIDS